VQRGKEGVSKKRRRGEEEEGKRKRTNGPAGLGVDGNLVVERLLGGHALVLFVVVKGESDRKSDAERRRKKGRKGEGRKRAK
jgi:hypothetical protein